MNSTIGGLQNGMPTIVRMMGSHGSDLMTDLIGVPQGNYIRDLRMFSLGPAWFVLIA